MDVIDTIVALRNKHKEKDGKTIGVDVIAGKVATSSPPASSSRPKSRGRRWHATETARLILRIDDIISSKGGSKGRHASGRTRRHGRHGHGLILSFLLFISFFIENDPRQAHPYGPLEKAPGPPQDPRAPERRPCHSASGEVAVPDGGISQQRPRKVRSRRFPSRSSQEGADGTVDESHSAFSAIGFWHQNPTAIASLLFVPCASHHHGRADPYHRRRRCAGSLLQSRRSRGSQVLGSLGLGEEPAGRLCGDGSRRRTRFTDRPAQLVQERPARRSSLQRQEPMGGSDRRVHGFQVSGSIIADKNN